MTRRRFHRSIAWLFAMAFIALQAIALAHEIQHDLRQHDDASCVLHLQAKSVGGNYHADILRAPLYTDAGMLPATDAAIDSPVHPAGYRSRAPPSNIR